MAKKETKTNIFSKINKEAFNKAKANPEKYEGTVEVPAGIKNGIAELGNVELKEYKSGQHKGEPFFMATAVIQEPATHEGKKAAGLVLTNTIPLTDRPEWTNAPTEEDFIGRMFTTLSKFGIDVSDLDETNLEATLKALSSKDGIHFKFSTGAAKSGNVFSNWYQTVDYQASTSADSNDDGVEVNEEEEEEGIDWDEVAKLADKDNSQAQLKIQEAAMEAGVTEEQMESAANWLEVVAMFE